MLNIARFIDENITDRSESMFLPDIDSNRAELKKLVERKKVLVIIYIFAL